MGINPESLVAVALPGQPEETGSMAAPAKDLPKEASGGDR